MAAVPGSNSEQIEGCCPLRSRRFTILLDYSETREQAHYADGCCRIWESGSPTCHLSCCMRAEAWMRNSRPDSRVLSTVILINSSGDLLARVT